LTCCLLEPTEFPEVSCDAIFSSSSLDIQTTLFKQMMRAQASKVMKKPIDINPVMRLWRSIDANSYLRHALSEWLILAEIAMVIVLGSVQDQSTFSIVSFMKNRLRNRLSTNLGLVVGFKSQRFYTLDTFPYDSAYESWHDEVKRQADN
jgi:hypothetical protein